MTALRVQMHLHGNPSVLLRNVAGQWVINIAYVVVLGRQSLPESRLKFSAHDSGFQSAPTVGPLLQLR